MALFNLLREPDSYNPDTWDVGLCPEAKQYWVDQSLDCFDHAVDYMLSVACQANKEKLTEIIASAKVVFRQEVDAIANQSADTPIAISDFDTLRFETLSDFNIVDPYLKLKAKENISASRHYHRLITAHDKLPNKQLIKVLTQGIFAGNIFDMGQKEIIDKMARDGGLDFYKTMDELPPRPWCVDHFDQWSQYYLSGEIKRVMMFVDNAGADFILGCLPMARQLAKGGATVYIVANDHPAINDMTVNECQTVLEALTRDDEMLSFLLQTNRIQVIGDGGHLPQVKLDDISETCNAVTTGVNLLIFVGMGRALETNYHALFKCPTLKLAMLKSGWHAEQFDGKKYGVVCRFDQ